MGLPESAFVARRRAASGLDVSLAGEDLFAALLQGKCGVIEGAFHPTSGLVHNLVGVVAQKGVCGVVAASVGIDGLDDLISASGIGGIPRWPPIPRTVTVQALSRRRTRYW